MLNSTMLFLFTQRCQESSNRKTPLRTQAAFDFRSSVRRALKA